MKLYLWLSGRYRALGCIEKLAVSVALAVFAPVIFTTALWISLGGSASPTALVAAAMLAGSVSAVLLVGVVRPFITLTRLATRQLDDYLVERRLPEAPSVPPADEIGQLLREVHDVCVQMECERYVLENDATSDHLSGLLNRRGGELLVADLLAEAATLGSSWSLALIDVDDFKQINDNFGHAVGDRALKMIARCLRTTQRDGVVLARWGGDEFVVFMLGDLHDLTASMEAFIDHVESSPVSTREGAVAVTASVGIAQARPLERLESVLERADVALYSAKRAGGGEVGTDPMPDLSTRRSGSDLIDSGRH